MRSAHANSCSCKSLTRTPVRAIFGRERMFVQDGLQNAYPRPRRRRGWGRVLGVEAVLVVATGRLAYGSGTLKADSVVVTPGDTLWSIASARYRGDPPPHVEAILEANHLTSPMLTPGQALLIPRE